MDRKHSKFAFTPYFVRNDQTDNTTKTKNQGMNELELQIVEWIELDIDWIKWLNLVVNQI